MPYSRPVAAPTSSDCFGGTKCCLDAFFSFYNTRQDGTSLRLYNSDAVPATTIMALSWFPL